MLCGAEQTTPREIHNRIQVFIEHNLYILNKTKKLYKVTKKWCYEYIKRKFKLKILDKICSTKNHGEIYKSFTDI